MVHTQPTPQLLATLYASPLQPELWGVFLQEFCATSGVSKSALIAHDFAAKDHRILACVGDSVKESIPLYEDHYSQLDQWTLRFPKHIAGRIVLGEEFCPEEFLLKSVFYNEFLKQFDVCQMACLAAAGQQGIFDALSIYRGPSENAFDREQLFMLQMIVPHLQTALYTRRKLAALETRVSDLEGALDRLDCGLILLDAMCRTIFINRNARAILDRQEGLSLRRGTIVANIPSEATALRGILAAAVNRDRGTPYPGAMLVSRCGKRPLQIAVSPYQPHATIGLGSAVAIVFVTDPEQRMATSAEILQLLFELTRAESRLAIALLDGKSLHEAAELIGVARETVRSQIKSIFQKTGTQRQGELIRLLSQLPATVSAESE